MRNPHADGELVLRPARRLHSAAPRRWRRRPPPRLQRPLSPPRALPGALALAGALLGSCLLLGDARGEALRPVATLRPERGFLDDAFALAPDGAALYYVVTDGATFAELRTAKLGQGARAQAEAGDKGPRPGALAGELTIPGLRIGTSGLVPLPEGRLLIVETDPEGQRKTAQVYSLEKKAPLPTRLGPATAIVPASLPAGPALVAYTATAGEHRFQAVSAATLRPLSDRRYRALPGGAVTVAGESKSLLYVGGDYQTLLLKEPGDYDKKADVRKPDRLAILDTLSGKVTRGETIADPTALAERREVLSRHPGEAAFLHLDAERGALQLWRVAGDGASHAPLKLPRPLSAYDPATLRYQPLGDGRLLFSLTVDPVNEAAVARKKRDADLMDLCVVSLAEGAAARCLGEIPGNDRPMSWAATADGTLALLRKHRGFSRGGAELELYRLDLGGAAPAAAGATGSKDDRPGAKAGK